MDLPFPANVPPASRGGHSSASDLEDYARDLNRRYGHLKAPELLRLCIRELFPGQIATVSSFGTEAAIVLQLVADIEKTVPVLFIDTLMHFMETLTYRDILLGRFGFTDARSIKPHPSDLGASDPTNTLWSSNPNLCCHIRKVLPLERGLNGFSAWITGRKRYQNSDRNALPKFEAANGRIKINPLADWSYEEVQEAFRTYKLPKHPLFDEGYASIGCSPEACTRRIQVGEDQRAGRWAGQDKTECGIHLDYTI